MKLFVKVLILVSLPNSLWSQDSTYHILLNAGTLQRTPLIDTLAPLDFLSLKKESGQMHIQDFEGFNYPKLELIIEGESVLLKNDTIEIRVISKPIDSLELKRKLSESKSLLNKSLYFRELHQDVEFPTFLPRNEISAIEVKVGSKSSTLAKEMLFDLYNPTLDCWTYLGTEVCGTNAYLTDNGEILVTLVCGEGAAASKVILLFSSEGKLKRKLSLPVIWGPHCILN